MHSYMCSHQPVIRSVSLKVLTEGGVNVASVLSQCLVPSMSLVAPLLIIFFNVFHAQCVLVSDWGGSGLLNISGDEASLINNIFIGDFNWFKAGLHGCLSASFSYDEGILPTF